MRVKELKINKDFTVDHFKQIAKTANMFESDIFIEGPNYKIDAKSFLGLLATIQTGAEIRVITIGEDEEEAIKECIQLFI
jgi:phosphocarrier protein HPr